MNEIKQNLVKLIATFNAKRVVSEGEIQEVLKAIVAILAANKQAVEALNSETKNQLKQALAYLEGEHKTLIKGITSDLTKTRAEIEKATKDQNDRAFKRLQTIINGIKLPKDGKDGLPGKDADPNEIANLVMSKIEQPKVTAESVRDALESLRDEERIDYKAIKGLPDYFKMAKRAGRQMLVGGIRFLENLADVSLPVADRRQNMIIQYNATTNRHESGVALTVGTTEPTNPKEGDIWIDTN